MSSDNDPSSQGITPEIAVNTDTLNGSQYWPASTLYVVATPIGNLSDISARAVQVLQAVDLIAAEDTRHSSGLVKHLNVDTPMIACHDHNEAAACKSVLDRLVAGQCVALISDAGTPLISDPGYKIVKSVREQGFRVSPIPGACAVISALSAAGLPTDRFAFEGFLPAKAQARQKRLQQLADATSTLVFYEAPHRIVATLQAMAEVLGAKREAVLARELTKRYETIIDDTLDELVRQVEADRNQQRGEMVIMVKGAASLADDRSA
ncbi:MAG: 16S rRNA (cytidine(1402)-2'-O)-methyltransferase, partial [Pseudomonadales bacterium]